VYKLSKERVGRPVFSPGVSNWDNFVIKPDQAKVLIADDDNDARQFLIDFLTEIGHKTLNASGGKQAIELATTEIPDVILLDIMMPDISGIEVCQALKDKEATKDIPVIFVTAKVGLNHQIVGLHAGAFDYINKPYRITELATRLNAAIRFKRLQNDLKQKEKKLETLIEELKDQVLRKVDLSLKLLQSIKLENDSQTDFTTALTQLQSSIENIEALINSYPPSS
jgi:DNA-binding response OmpR family regulator